MRRRRRRRRRALSRGSSGFGAGCWCWCRLIVLIVQVLAMCKVCVWAYCHSAAVPRVLCGLKLVCMHVQRLLVPVRMEARRQGHAHQSPLPTTITQTGGPPLQCPVLSKGLA